MYQPKKYKKDNPEYIFDFIKNHPFASFVMNGESLLATHIPLLAEGTAENFRLYSHIANHNEQQPFLKNGAEALLIFKGADGYVSSSWYREKNISTWDYSAVHLNVKIIVQTPQELETSLQKLVHHFEKDQKNPLFYKDIPTKMVQENLPQITGFWATPTRIQAVAKLHQGYEDHDVRAVVEQLGKMENPMAVCLRKDIQKEHGFDK